MHPNVVAIIIYLSANQFYETKVYEYYTYISKLNSKISSTNQILIFHDSLITKDLLFAFPSNFLNLIYILCMHK